MITMAEYEIEFRCKHCGKPISILYPSQWGYKVRNKKGGWNYFCTWKCLRADERKEPKPVQVEEQEKEIKNNRVQVLEKLMAAAEDGRDIYAYLREEGYTDPKDTLRRLRIKAKKEAPEIYRKMEQMGLLDLRAKNSGKGVDKMSQNKLTREQKEKAVKIALEGGDYLEHLKKCGAKNPSAAWWYIKKTLAKSNPKLLAEVMKKTNEVEVKLPKPFEGGVTETIADEVAEWTPGAVEIAEKLPPEAVAEVPEQEPVIMSREEHKKAHTDEEAAFVEAANMFHQILQPLQKKDKYDGFKVTAIDGEFGQYRTDGDKIYFNNPAKIMYFGFNKEELPAFLEETKRAAQILGVQF